MPPPRRQRVLGVCTGPSSQKQKQKRRAISFFLFLLFHCRTRDLLSTVARDHAKLVNNFNGSLTTVCEHVCEINGSTSVQARAPRARLRSSRLRRRCLKSCALKRARPRGIQAGS